MHHVKVLAKRLHLNSHRAGSRPQALKLEPPYNTSSKCESKVLYCFFDFLAAVPNEGSSKLYI